MSTTEYANSHAASQDDLAKPIDGLEKTPGVQAATGAGAQATQAATLAGAQTTRAAAHAGTWSTMIAGLCGARHRAIPRRHRHKGVNRTVTV